MGGGWNECTSTSEVHTGVSEENTVVECVCGEGGGGGLLVRQRHVIDDLCV